MNISPKLVAKLLANPPRRFTENDLLKPQSQLSTNHDTISCQKSDLVRYEPWWMKKGLTETKSGYGMRLNSGLLIDYNGRLYRIYVTTYGNAGSSWFKARGKKIYVHAS